MVEPPSSVDAERTTNLLARPLTLPCGAVLKNRVAKSCMSDSLGDGQGHPTAAQVRLYERWAQGGVAVSCIGEVQTDPRYPEKPGNLVLASHLDEALEKKSDASSSSLTLWKDLTRRGTVDQAHLWAQLGHAGALTHAPINAQPKGPSALQELPNVQALSLAEIQALPALYAAAARRAQAVGFTGVMVHAGHGFLLSPLFNKRKDIYGGNNVANRSRLLVEIVHAIRQAVGPRFPVAMRINSTDQLEGGLLEEDALEVVRLLDETMLLDLLDISGGTYFPGAKAASDSSHTGGPYFLDFCRRARQVTKKNKLLLMLTGGFKTRQQAVDALATGWVDMIGVARAMVLDPALAQKWTTHNPTATNKNVVDPVFPRFTTTVPGGITAWFTMRLTALGNDEEDNFHMDLPTAVKVYDKRDDDRVGEWKRAFQI